ncbi:hypothetical protein K4S27_11080 [Staphylococcus epidermidis]|nr:hypothetical protein [Staphylococcus epidermidis]MCG2360220.1 hypothetical protein [Staphylococcus epidermidis]MCG2367174.1 hypothetical protein [Staphylococcus epidermidis]
MDEIIKVVKKILFKDGEGTIYLNKLGEDEDLKELERKGYIEIVDYKPIDMFNEGEMEIKKGKNYNKL